jgi:hypothetical protein
MDLSLFFTRVLTAFADAAEATADRLHERAVQLDAIHAETIHGTDREVMYARLEEEALTHAVACDAFAKSLRQSRDIVRKL